MGGNTGTIPQLPYHFIPPTIPTLPTHHIPSTPHRSRFYVATFLVQCARVPRVGKRSNKGLQAKIKDSAPSGAWGDSTDLLASESRCLLTWFTGRGGVFTVVAAENKKVPRRQARGATLPTF